MAVELHVNFIMCLNRLLLQIRVLIVIIVAEIFGDINSLDLIKNEEEKTFISIQASF